MLVVNKRWLSTLLQWAFVARSICTDYFFQTLALALALSFFLSLSLSLPNILTKNKAFTTRSERVEHLERQERVEEWVRRVNERKWEREREWERERGPTKNWVPDKQYTFTSHKHIGHWATNREWERILKKCEQCSLVAEKNQPTRLQSSVYGQISFQKICERWIDWSRKFLSFYSFSLPCFTSGVWSSLFPKISVGEKQQQQQQQFVR